MKTIYRNNKATSEGEILLIEAWPDQDRKKY
jgi:hypothetical protein